MLPTIPPLHLFLLALILFLAGAILPLLAGCRRRLAHGLGLAACLAGGLTGFLAAYLSLASGKPEHFHYFWTSAGEDFILTLDGLAAFFLLPLFLLVFCCGLYAFRYLSPESGGFRTARHWLFFNTLAGSMALVVAAANSLLFLLAWEVMSLSSFFLVIHEFGDEQVRRAGWLYLIATHLGTAFLFCLFLAEYRLTDSLNFSSFVALQDLPPEGVFAMFTLAIIGFGTKAGMFPMHSWLPEAHAAAPSHVSALMSGVMIKTAVYGLLRILTFLPPLTPWYGLLLTVLGLGGGLYGIAMAAAQPDLKKSLAFSSVENIGIIFLGLGLWLYCRATGYEAAAALALAGMLLHIWNHAAFKSLLFLGAGSILHATGIRIISKLGGLQQRMPVTGLLMLTGGAAIAALPPLNGFVSELLIYLGLAQAGRSAPGGQAFLFMIFAILLALTGGIVLLVMTRLLGITLGGMPRSALSGHVHESKPSMLAAMVLPALCCLGIGTFPQVAMMSLPKPMHVLAPAGLDPAAALHLPFGPAWSLGGLLLIGAGAGIVLIRHRRSPAMSLPTWGCGFLTPSARMAYTAGSFTHFAQNGMCSSGLRPMSDHTAPPEHFPAPLSVTQEYTDPVLTRIFSPFFRQCAALAHTFHRLQAGRMNIYLTYIFTTTVLLLGWSFFWQ